MESEATFVHCLQVVLVNRSEAHVIVCRCGVAALEGSRRCEESVVFPDWVMLPIHLIFVFWKKLTCTWSVLLQLLDTEISISSVCRP